MNSQPVCGMDLFLLFLCFASGAYEALGCFGQLVYCMILGTLLLLWAY